MGDDGVCAGLGHGPGFRGRRDIDDGEQIHFAGQRDHLELLLHAHAGLLEDLPEHAVHDAMGGEIVHAGEAHVLDLKQPVPHAPAGIGGMHAADDRDFLHDRQHFELAYLHRHRIGVAVSHQTAGGAVAGHAKSARVVNDDQVGATAFDELGADTRAGAGGDDRLTSPECGAEAFDDFFAAIGVSFSGPGIRHGWLRR